MKEEKLKIIKKNIEELKKMDDESAHSQEDRLRGLVLEDIASGKYTKEECQIFAKEVLKTREIKFERWCA